MDAGIAATFAGAGVGVAMGAADAAGVTTCAGGEGVATWLIALGSVINASGYHIITMNSINQSTGVHNRNE